MLVIGQFILSLFSSDWIIVNVVNNITSDVLYKIYKILSIDFLCMQFSRYIKMRAAGKTVLR